MKIAKQRLDKSTPLDETLVSGKLEAKAPRVAFGLLVDIGLIKAGATLTSKDGKYSATVTANGSLKSGDVEGSIHKVGAVLQDQPSCNGWTFWHIDGALIDDIRQKYLEQNYA